MLFNTTMKSAATESLLVAYYSLTLIIVGTLCNLWTFIVLCRLSFRDKRTRATLHFMRTIAIFDILMLYGWNLDHYLAGIYGFTLLRYSVPSCKFIGFLSYFIPQTSAWLRVFICIDRYLSVSHLHRTWLHRSKSVLIIITCTIIAAILLNLHILVFVCYRQIDGTIDVEARSYQMYPLWDYVNLGVYNCAPFIFMVVFNSGVIYHLIHLRHTTILRNSRIRHRSITITLIITTFLFLIMTIPATVAYGFFTKSDVIILWLLDGILYTYHITSLPLYLTTFSEFRRECIVILTCKHVNRKVQPRISIRLKRMNG